MLKRVMAIAMAFVGLSVGAGFASGQEVLQFFVVFGHAGLWGAVAVALMMCVIGLVILQLGSYYQATEHTAVFDKVAHPVAAKFLDGSVMLTIFSLGMVMFAGAGANLNQQFGLPIWVGAVILLVLVVVLGRLDVDKVSNIIGAITPGIILFIVIAAVYAFATAPDDWSHLEESASTIRTTLPNVWVGALNYLGFSLIVVVSMSIVIGGYYLNARIAGIGGLLGGGIFGLMLCLVASSLFLKVDMLKDDAMPMLTLVGLMHPIMGTLMSVAIYGMIFNSALGMFYALTRRLTVTKPQNFNSTFVMAVLVGFVLSFLGFRTLVTYLYPLLGYVGVALMFVLVYAWIRDRGVIVNEVKRRQRIRALVTRKLDPARKFTAVHQRELARRLKASNIDEEEMAATVREKVARQLDEDESVDFSIDDNSSSGHGSSRVN
ncbi:hypothetical protein M0E87_07960 [Corynebacterium sp. CCM 9185]|uniref:Membrane protein YkvI n=1 Tax=Corynebacterium marambiense TaxID=2765364 RepID=A0ABS0VTY0_9CORY|nr:hypothetical protein [Corynebacterium marambiense]MBI9000241.1 hypothetical protein [Corynebacterium marambiense]MCK7663595.1 hypothetical protein [Corynebacterium marambiense]MCX7541971.1 hypothetical protein [Corynebacterium marambiense]